jgi:hypothetical protein
VKRLVAAAAATLATGCATSVVLPADPRATLDPVAFFNGRTHGDATLRKVFSAPVPVTVDSVGRLNNHGNLQLEQVISEGGKSSRRRWWVMERAGPGRLTGTLTDAEGPVAITLAGPRATIRYRMKGGLDVEQQLALQPGGRTILNQLTVSKLGVRVARLDETIRKLD